MKKQVSGFLIWAAFLAILSFYPFFLSPIKPHEAVTLGEMAARAIVSAPLGMKFIAIAGGILSIALCYLFFKIAKKKTKRLWYAKIPGFLFFGIGTGYIIIGTGRIAQIAFLQTRVDYTLLSLILTAIESTFIVSVILIPLSYIMIFRKKQPVSEVEEQIMNETGNENN